MSSSPIVHALLVCRRVEPDEAGNVSLHNVVEILPATSLPGDIGPLTFVAFVRNLPAGPGQGAFVLRPANPEDPALGRLPLELEVPAVFGNRQIALHVTVPSLRISAGGWIEYAFTWNGETLAANRFAVGVR